ncbi:putative motility protein [Motiliproteus sp. MSK22-1]|uniref:putative motility protein n=1 Tax=Motiliproteus sp. MSK22-1 TaxID=1897630 RepID=UPI000976EAA0|nr:YjfB family protein [Motiliproteus sp. MSK22-1]OMH29092.1 hypothetical protein BGP75_20275 [Motiliproteus sp. MSK22-1]
MEISSLSLSSPTTLSNASLHQEIALRVLKDSIDLQGQLALSLLPQPPQLDPSSSLGQNIDIHV